MPSMIDMLGAQAVKDNSTSVLSGLPEAVKTGMNIAQAAQNIEAQKQQVAAQKSDLEQKKMNGLSNILRAGASTSDAKQRALILDRGQKLADQYGLPFDRSGIENTLNDDGLRNQVLSGLNDLNNGKIPKDPTQFFSLVGGTGDQGTYDWASNRMFENSKAQNEMASNEKIAALRAQTAEEFYRTKRDDNLSKEDRAREERESEKINKGVVDLAKNLSKDLPEVVSTIKTINELTGGIYSDEAVGKFDKVAGVPGFFAGLKIPMTEIAPFENAALKGKDLKLYQSVAALRNQYLKLRSGGAVSDKESDRFTQELGAGGVRSGTQMANGIRSLNNAIQTAIKNIEAGSDPAAVSLYRERSGSISSDQLPSANASPDVRSTPRGAPTKREIFIKQVGNGKYKNYETGKPFTPEEAAARFDKTYPGAK